MKRLFARLPLLGMALLVAGCTPPGSATSTYVAEEYDSIVKQRRLESRQKTAQLHRQNRILQQQYALLEEQRRVYHEREEERASLETRFQTREAQVDARAAALKKKEAGLAALTKKSTAAVAALTKTHAAQTKILAALTAKVNTLNASLPAIKKEFAFLTKSNDAKKIAQREAALARQIAETNKRVTAQVAALKSAEVLLKKAETSFQLVRDQVKKNDADAAGLKKALAVKETLLAGLAKQLKQKADGSVELAKQLAAARTEEAKQKADLQASRSVAGNVQRAVAVYTVRVKILEELKGRLARLRNETGALAVARKKGGSDRKGTSGTAKGRTGRKIFARATFVSKRLLIK